jgi:hypothetical protein
MCLGRGEKGGLTTLFIHSSIIHPWAGQHHTSLQPVIFWLCITKKAKLKLKSALKRFSIAIN